MQNKKKILKLAGTREIIINYFIDFSVVYCV